MSLPNEKEINIIKSDAPMHYTLGIVYEPNVVDAQGDYSTSPEIEDACHDFMRRLQKSNTVTSRAVQIIDSLIKGKDAQIDITDFYDTEDIEKGAVGLMHKDWSDTNGDIVECYIAPTDMVVNGQAVKKGTWLLGIIWNPEIFKQIENGTLTGYSMGGKGVRIPDGT